MSRKSVSLQQFRDIVRNDYKKLSEKGKRHQELLNCLYWFVDECPSFAGPEKALKFKNYGIMTGHDYSMLKKHIISSIGLKKDDTYKYVECANLDSLIEEIRERYESRHKAIVFFSKGELGEMDSLYIRIRNSFAHGNYFLKNDYYCLWNETGKQEKKIGSFMMLKYDNLKAIRDVLKENQKG